MKHTLFIFLITPLFFTMHNAIAMKQLKPPRAHKLKKVYRYSPGVYHRKVSPGKTRLFITKNSRKESSTIQIPEEMQQLYRRHMSETFQLKDSNDQQTQKFCNKS